MAVSVLGWAMAWLIGGAAPPSAPASSLEQKLIKRFDKDGDGQLSKQERNEARRLLQGRRQKEMNRKAQASRPAGNSDRAKRIQLPPGTKALRDVEYARVGDKSIKLDLYLPEKVKRLMPVIVWIHGGAWEAGSKNGCPFVAKTAEGYAVVSIDYRLSDVAIFPAQIHDCKAAIRWVRANAAQYGFDPDRIGVAGSSAGGHLVALLGTSGGVKELEGDVGGNLQYSSKVQAVVDFCGPADFTGVAPLSNDAEHRESPVLLKLFGGPLHENKEKARLASPLAFVSKDDPPILIVHGDQDKVVPVKQSVVFADKLKRAGVDVTLHVAKGASHGVMNAGTIPMASAFLDEYLMPSAVGKTHHAASQPVQ